MFRNSTLNEIIKPLRLLRAEEIMKDHDKASNSKGFRSWDQLISMLVCQLESHDSLRSLVSAYNSHSEQHYHLRTNPVARSTLSYANENRDFGAFSNILHELIGYAGGLSKNIKKNSREITNLVDSSPIPLNPKLFGDLAVSNGRIKGMKLHLEYDVTHGIPTNAEFTPANVNDIDFVKNMQIKHGETYVFDKGYCSFDFWTKLQDAHCRFVTRIKANMPYEVLETRAFSANQKSIIFDKVIKLTGKKAINNLNFNLRLIRIKRENGNEITIISNDTLSPACKIAELYKIRWQIELFFKWIKQNLKIKNFIGRSENAIKIQIVTALIAYLLVYIHNHHEDGNRSFLETLREVQTHLYQRIRTKDIVDRHKVKHEKQLELKGLEAYHPSVLR